MNIIQLEISETDCIRCENTLYIDVRNKTPPFIMPLCTKHFNEIISKQMESISIGLTNVDFSKIEMFDFSITTEPTKTQRVKWWIRRRCQSLRV